jgi:hypothetical protein
MEALNDKARMASVQASAKKKSVRNGRVFFAPAIARSSQTTSAEFNAAPRSGIGVNRGRSPHLCRVAFKAHGKQKGRCVASRRLSEGENVQSSLVSVS